MKISVLEPLSVADEKLRALLAFDGVELTTYPDRKNDEASLIARSQDADIVVFSNIKYPASVMAACPRLKYICCAFTGTDHIDLDYCREHGIKVSNCAGYSTAAVADLVFGMLIDLYRRIDQNNQNIHANGNRIPYLGPELEGKTMGIIGYGAIGSRVGAIAKAFGCRVIACSRTEKQVEGVQFTDLDSLLAQSDIVSIHVPQNAQTKGLISREKIALMKRDAILINCARGPIVDSQALADALNEGRLAGAGIDVFETEPPIDTTHPLLKAANCICTPHIAFSSVQAMEKRALIVRDNIENYLNGKQINTVI